MSGLIEGWQQLGLVLAPDRSPWPVVWLRAAPPEDLWKSGETKWYTSNLGALFEQYEIELLPYFGASAPPMDFEDWLDWWKCHRQAGTSRRALDALLAKLQGARSSCRACSRL